MEDYGLTTNILFQAEDFYEAFKRCNKEMPYQSSSGNGTIVSIPAIVNGAFALELYFNYLSKEYHVSHHLSELYSYIDEDIKKEIENRTIKELKSIFQYKDYSFEQIIKDMDSLFVEWRYIFDKNKSVCFFGNGINRYIPALTILLREISLFVSTNKKCIR